MPNKRFKRPLIVPLFIPNHGCPHRCIFCRQETITSQSSLTIDGIRIRQTLDHALESKTFGLYQDREVAFYGGTFTRLPVLKMTDMLETVSPYLKQGYFQTIRVSTRPDAIDEQRLNLLQSFGVSTVELGAQSLDDEVLTLSRRGYASADIIQAVHTLQAYGFKVGIQLMPGLPGDSEERFMDTIDKVLRLKPNMVRLYPVIVIKGTELEKLYHKGLYQPFSLEEAVSICQDSCIRLEKNGIPVIRIGLMSSPALMDKGQIIAGPWHNAFGYLVRSRIHQKNIEPDLPQKGSVSRFGLRAPEREISIIRGYKNQGLEDIEGKTGAKVVYIKPDDSVPLGRVAVDKIK